jgi:hypothetical protein
LGQSANSVDAPDVPRAKVPDGEKSNVQIGDNVHDKTSQPADGAMQDARVAAYGPGAQMPIRDTASSATIAALPSFDGFPLSEKSIKTKPDAVTVPPELSADVSDRSKESKLGSPQSSLSPEGQALLASAEKSIKVPGYPNAEKEFAQFTKDLETFEKSAREQGLSPQEVKDTYKGIGRLLDSAAPGKPGVTEAGMTSDRQRVRVAEQLMNMVARPEDRQQGNFDTCAMASVEGMLLTGRDRQPSKVTGMVADVALTGHTNVGGIDVKIDKRSMQSFGEHADNRGAGENKQRLAENIFRLTAANTYYGIMRAEGSPEGQLSYVSGKDGNQLKYTPDANDPTKHKPEYAQLNKPEGRETSPGPAATMTGESRILNQITGKDYSDRLIVNSATKGEDPKWVKLVSSQSELDTHLKQLQDQGKMPVALGVFAGHRIFSDGENPFNQLSQSSSDKDIKRVFDSMYQDGHSLLVTGANQFGFGTRYDIKNTWGADSSKSVSNRELFESTRPVSPSEMVGNLELWRVGNLDMQDKKERSKYETGIGLAVLYVVGGYTNLSDNVPQSVKNDYVQAGRRLKDIMQGMTPESQKELVKVEKQLQEQAKKDPQYKTFYENWKRLLH